MGVGIQNKTEKLFRQEECYPEDELIPFFDTSAGPFSDDFEEQLLSRIAANFEAGLNLAIAANFEAGRNLAIATSSEEESDSNNSDSFLYEDLYFRIDADVLDEAARHYHESDDE